MKKWLLLVFALLLTGCASPPAPDIEAHEWFIEAIQDEAGDLIAQDVRLTASASNGTLVITDETNGVQYAASLREYARGQGTITWSLVLDGQGGMAAISTTRYFGGTSRPTLVMTVNGYSLTFSGK